MTQVAPRDLGAKGPRRAHAGSRPRPGPRSVDPAARSVPAAYRREGSPREPLPPRDRRDPPRRAASDSLNCSAWNGPAWKSDSSQRSSASPSSASSSTSPSRARRFVARPARNESSRVGSPLGWVAAIGRTGRMPYGRQSSRSKRTGPAAIGAAVARRMAVTASANSPGASGGSVAPESSARSSSSTLRRSGSRPKSVGRSPFASGHSFASSPVPAARMRMPLPSSIVAPPVVIPITGAMAPYW